MASNEIKDKRILLENRKLIETVSSCVFTEFENVFQNIIDLELFVLNVFT